jgi:hypothetical protein
MIMRAKTSMMALSKLIADCCCRLLEFISIYLAFFLIFIDTLPIFFCTSSRFILLLLNMLFCFSLLLGSSLRSCLGLFF